MALETFGTDVAKVVDRAAVACHDVVKDAGKHAHFLAGEVGIWDVKPSMMPGQEAGTEIPCVQIRLAVG